MRQKALFSFFANFSKTLNSKKIGIIFSKDGGYLKGFFRQSFRIFDFSNLASHSRYFQSVTLKYQLLLNAADIYCFIKEKRTYYNAFNVSTVFVTF